MTGADGLLVGIVTEIDLLQALEQILRGRIVRPGAIREVGARERYEYGFRLRSGAAGPLLARG